MANDFKLVNRQLINPFNIVNRAIEIQRIPGLIQDRVFYLVGFDEFGDVVFLAVVEFDDVEAVVGAE